VSTALQKAHQRYAATPRELDALLERKARGDRGCIFDLFSGVGILSSFACLIASQMGVIAFTWTYLGIAVWVGSYFLGARAQGQSGQQRRLAMEQGRLVPSVVVTGEAHLRQGGNRRSGRALVLFALREEGAGFELSGTQRKLAELLDGELPEGDGPGLTHLRKALGDEFCFDFVPIGPELRSTLGVGKSDDERGDVYMTRVVVDPEQAEEGKVRGGDALALIVHLDSQIAEAV
jgi:hypothetical protein